jgi:hypothetical protein
VNDSLSDLSSAIVDAVEDAVAEVVDREAIGTRLRKAFNVEEYADSVLENDYELCISIGKPGELIACAGGVDADSVLSPHKLEKTETFESILEQIGGDVTDGISDKELESWRKEFSAAADVIAQRLAQRKMARCSGRRDGRREHE